jgi:hypothetical protein
VLRVSIDAIALVKVPYATACKLHNIEPAQTSAGALTESYPFVPVGQDATACYLDVPFSSEPADLAAATRHLMGKALDPHDDPKGVLIAPSVALERQAFSSYAEAVTEVGEVGEWVPKVTAEAAIAQLGDRAFAMGGLDASGLPAGLDGMASMLGGLGGGDLRALSAQVGQMMAQNPGMAQAAQSAFANTAGPKSTEAQQEGGFDLFQAAQAMLSNMSDDQRAQIEKMAMGLFGQMGGAADAAKDGGPDGGPGHGPDKRDAPKKK